MAGHTAASFLRTWTGRNDSVVVVSPRPTYNWIPSNIWVGVGTMPASKVVFPLAEAIVPASGIRLPARLAATMATQWLPWSMVGMQFATGFFIGALMLREVRRAGHSRVVLTPVKPLEPLALPRAAGRLPVPVPGPAQ